MIVMVKEKPTKINVIVNGLPGKMATIIFKGILKEYSTVYNLIPYALTGPGQPRIKNIEDTEIELIEPKEHDISLLEIKEQYSNIYGIDFCKGEGVANRNAELYSKHKIPFVMGSTGADYGLIDKLAKENEIACVAWPNMDIGINVWMYGLSKMAEDFEGAFLGRKVSLTETHQADKINKSTGLPETSGTMKQMLTNIGKLIDENLTVADIYSIRDPNVQAKLLEVPEEYLGWHAFHWFKFYNEHNGVKDSEELIIKRFGGECYRQGAMIALDYSVQQNSLGYFGNHTMIDVLKTKKII